MRLLVRSIPGIPWRGYLYMEGLRIPCALGKHGVQWKQCEGDGITPIGMFPLRYLLYRQHCRISICRLPAYPIHPRDGWCDDPEQSAYNRPVQRPSRGNSESLWRQDRLYDLMIVIGYNDSPPQPGKGSAIFLHATRHHHQGLSPTRGCIALPRSALRRLAARLRPGAQIEIIS